MGWCGEGAGERTKDPQVFHACACLLNQPGSFMACGLILPGTRLLFSDASQTLRRVQQIESSICTSPFTNL